MPRSIDWNSTVAAVWRERSQNLKPIHALDPVGLESLVGIDRQKTQIIENTERFLQKLPRNHVLLWGARGTGKSTIIKALLNRYASDGLRIIEFPRESLGWLPDVSDELRELPYRFIIFCDDLSFESGESGYKGLKTILEGSLEMPPENVCVYATSNRRHLVPEYMSDNLGATVGERGELHLSDSVEERISLADRFGLSVSFYHGNQEDYLAIVRSYFDVNDAEWMGLSEEAKRYARERASYSGRTAKQFYNAWISRKR